MNRWIPCVLVGIALQASPSGQAEELAGLYNTGVDDQGSPLPLGEPDPHYLTERGVPSVRAPAEGWVSSGADARWIEAMGDRRDASLNFTLTVFVPPEADLESVVITGRVAADPGLDILLPGGPGLDGDWVGARPTHRSLFSFEIDNSEILDVNHRVGFMHGENELSFRAQAIGSSGRRASMLVTDLEGSYERRTEQPWTQELTGLFPTGVDAEGNRIPLGASDPHYHPENGTTAVAIPPDSGLWVQPPPPARWIAANGNRSDVSLRFEFEVVIPQEADLRTVLIRGRVAGDPSYDIILPGGETLEGRWARDGQPAWTLLPFVIDNSKHLDPNRGRGLVHGPNTISFRAQRIGGGRGAILVTDLEGSYVGPAPTFIRGDCNGDGDATGMLDAIVMLQANFLGGAHRPCLAACDVTGDGETAGILDALTLLTWNFIGDVGIPDPHPLCGPGLLESDWLLGCEEPTECP